MKHLTVGVFLLSIFIISLHNKIVSIDMKLLHKNAWKILNWIVGILLGAIISFWIK